MLKLLQNLKKKIRKSEREFNTPLYILRTIQAGLTLSDLEVLDYGFVLDIITELDNDSFDYKDKATQADFDRF